MKHFAICNPLRKNVWYVARSSSSGEALYIIATTTEHHARDLARAMNANPASNEVIEPSEVVDQRLNYKTPWPVRSGQN